MKRIEIYGKDSDWWKPLQQCYKIMNDGETAELRFGNQRTSLTIWRSINPISGICKPQRYIWISDENPRDSGFKETNN
ncbi:hypothetical protein LCGC14_1397490 [marine sediment metagenome]|uniref:Uncharacterized protein n=1 Tax=marine sediment metagenome TaxID=412755 RepID=A0A0F9KJ03_9ZZZZ